MSDNLSSHLGPALQLAEQRYQALAEDTADYVLRTDRALTVRFANRALCDYLCLSPDRVIGRTLRELASPETVEFLEEVTAELGPKQPRLTRRLVIRHADGTRRLHSWTFRAILTRRGTVLEYQGTGRDITPQQQLADEFLRTSQEVTGDHQKLASHIAGLITAVHPTEIATMIGRLHPENPLPGVLARILLSHACGRWDHGAEKELQYLAQGHILPEVAPEPTPIEGGTAAAAGSR
jgi:PAS domain S-box-containing protein